MGNCAVELFKKQIIAYRLFLIMLALVGCLSLTACEGKIFDEQEEVTIQRYGKEELQNGKYYVKDGTSFYEPYISPNNLSGQANCVWLDKGEEKFVPTLYADDILVFVSSGVIPEHIQLQHMNDCGYSIGMIGFYPVKTGQVVQYMTGLSNLRIGSSAHEVLSIINASNITLADINEKEVQESDFAKGGVLKGLEYGKTYHLGIYVGSFYKTHKVVADTRIMVTESEIFLEDISLTKNGYYAVRMPEDLQSGYYRIKDQGLFRYVNTDKRTELSKDRGSAK